MIRLAAWRFGSNAYTSNERSAAANGNVSSPSCAPTSIHIFRYLRDRAHFTTVSCRARRRALRRKVAAVSQRPEGMVDSAPLTIFSAPKAFKGHFGFIQQNAIRSWLSLRPKPTIILFCNEDGTAEVLRGLDVQLVSDIATNSFGTPLVSDMFRQADSRATSDVVAFVSADVILTERAQQAAHIAIAWSP